MRRMLLTVMAYGLILIAAADAQTTQSASFQAGEFANHPMKVWVKQSPVEGRPAAPKPLQYEGGAAYDPFSGKLLHHGGHEGIYQTERTFAYDLASGRWQQRFPNTSPPGACCLNNNGPAFDIANRRLVRFPAGSLGHGWQFSRSVYLKESPRAVWTYDQVTNTWSAMRPPPYSPAPKGTRDWVIGGLCHESTYDPLHEVIVHVPNTGGETIIYTYDVYANALDMFKAKAGPGVRGACGVVYDAKNGRLVVFGNGMGSDPRTWLFDLKTSTWTALEIDPHPPTDNEGEYSTHPVMAYDSRNDVMLCVIWHPRTGQHETWALDTLTTPKWTKMNPPAEPDPGASRARNLAYSAEHNVFILELAAKTGPNQIWTFRYAASGPDAVPQPPADLEALTDASKAVLTWKPSATLGVKEYRILRAEADKAWQAEYKPLGMAREVTFTDTGLTAGKTYFYKVAAVGADGREGKPSISARTSPRVPAAPVVSALAADKIEVKWMPHPARDVTGYNVYRGLVTVKAVRQGKPEPWRDNDPEYPEPRVCRVNDVTGIVKLNDAPLAGTSFADAKADLATTKPESGEYKYAVYAYVVRAVNRLGVESGPSPYALTIPAEPTNVLVRNLDGGRWELKWDANPEAGIVGYRVYRTKGGQVHEPLTPLSDPPVRGTRVQGIGEGRLWVTAVDALGQEGQPSSPANVNPTYKGFFDGEWHQ